MERETGIEPATNSLEGCDSTTELLPPTLNARSLSAPAGKPLLSHIAAATLSGVEAAQRHRAATSAVAATLLRSRRRSVARSNWLATRSRARSARLAQGGGEGRIRTSEAARATDLQSAAFDRSATSPRSYNGPRTLAGRHALRDTRRRPEDDARGIVRGT